MDLSEVRDATLPRHPWETARAVAIERILGAAALTPTSILDFGCGDGFTGEHVARVTGAERLCGFDVNLTDAQCTELSAGRSTYTNDLQTLGQHGFDLCLLCDVIEHVADDRALLVEVGRRLGDGGFALITVPSFQSLFSSHDRALKHFRRYSRRELEELVRAGGYEVVGSGYLFASLLPARAATKFLERVKPPMDQDFGIGRWEGSAAVTLALEKLLSVDNALLLWLAAHGLKLPGLSAWALSRKRPS